MQQSCAKKHRKYGGFFTFWHSSSRLNAWALCGDEISQFRRTQRCGMHFFRTSIYIKRQNQTEQ